MTCYIFDNFDKGRQLIKREKQWLYKRNQNDNNNNKNPKPKKKNLKYSGNNIENAQ